MTAETINARCDQCQKAKQVKPKTNGEARLPSSWKVFRASVYCDKCWKRSYVLRPLTMPVIGPVDATKDEWWAALRQAWRDAAELATWASQQLFTNDVVLKPGDEKLPPMPPIYLYGLANDQGMIRSGEASSRQCLLRWVEQTYKARRKDVIYRRSARPPAYTYPCPWRVHNRDWEPSRDENGGHPLLSLTVGGRRWMVRLWSGERGRHRNANMKRFDMLCNSEVLQGEMMLVPRKAHGRESGTATERRNGGGQKKVIGCDAKLLAWWPRNNRVLSGDPVHCHTDGDALLVYRHGNDIHRLNYHHVRRWVLEYERRRHNFSEDMKPERRAPARKRRRYVESQHDQQRKHHNRIKSACQQAAAAVVNYALRRRSPQIIYDDTRRDWIEQFPWHHLQQSIIHCADREGVCLVEASGEVLCDPLGLLADTEG